MISPMWHFRLSTLALIVAAGVCAAHQSNAAQKIAVRQQPESSAGRKIEFSEPSKPIIAQQQKPDGTDAQTAAIMKKFGGQSSLDEYDFVLPMVPVVIAPKKEKKESWLSDKMPEDLARETDSTASPSSINSTLTRGWMKQDRLNNGLSRPNDFTSKDNDSDRDQDRNSDRSSSDSIRNGSSRSDWLGRSDSQKDRYGERGWGATKSRLYDSPFRDSYDNSRDPEDTKRMEDAQSRMNDYRALFNMSSSTTPAGAPNAANPIHDSLWGSTGERRAWSEFSRTQQPDFSQPMQSGIPDYNSSPAFDPSAFGRSRQAQEQQSKRYEAPAILEMPRHPGSLLK